MRCAEQRGHTAQLPTPPLPSHRLGGPRPDLFIFTLAHTEADGLFWGWFFFFNAIDLVL